MEEERDLGIEIKSLRDKIKKYWGQFVFWYQNDLLSFIKLCGSGILASSRKVKKDPLNPNLIFSIIWIGMAFLFFKGAISSRSQAKITLPLYENKLPEGFSFSGQDLGQYINNLSSSYNANVSTLQDAVRSSAEVTFILNLMSGLLALIGFFAQVMQYLKDFEKASKDNEADRNNKDSDSGGVIKSKEEKK